MILVRGVLFNLLFFGFTLVLGLVGMPAFLLGRRPVRAIASPAATSAGSVAGAAGWAGGWAA